jgi:hypothetical protein
VNPNSKAGRTDGARLSQPQPLERIERWKSRFRFGLVFGAVAETAAHRHDSDFGIRVERPVDFTAHVIPLVPRLRMKGRENRRATIP